TELHRLKGKISSDSLVTDVRFELEEKGIKTEEYWAWKKNYFSGTRELNGLRVLMATINGWDLKDENNSVYEVKDKESREEVRLFLVSDLGATFGTPNLVKGHDKSRGNLVAYERSRFITRMTAERVDFASPGRPTWMALVNPKQYFARIKL